MDNLSNEQHETERPAERVTEPLEAAKSKERRPIENLSAQLGYVESPEMTAARLRWIAALQSGQQDKAREEAITYQEQAEAADARHLEAFRQGRQLVLAWLAEGGDPVRGDEILSEASSLGFLETGKMRTARARIALEQSSREGSDDDVKVAELNDYERLANELEARYGAEFQVGLLIAKATVYRDAGQVDYFQEDLADTVTYAENLGLTSVVEELERELDEQ